jgi:hypothetical protein
MEHTDMNEASRPRPQPPDGPPPAGGDYITVDDTGDFGYHRSEQDLLAAFEYVGEARSIIDRRGNDYLLVMDPNRRLVLGPALGPVEFHWLGQAWRAAQNMHAERHRIRRFYAGSRDQLLRDLFETLVLEHAADPAAGSWTLEAGGVTTRLRNLQEVDRRLSRQDRLETARVSDPFGRTYRPVLHRRHWYMPTAAGLIVYVETPRRAERQK